MPELSNTIPNTTFVEAIPVPLSQKQLTDPPSPKMMCEAEIDIAQDSLPGDRVIHDCQELMGFSDIFQEMNDLALKLNSTQQNEQAVGEIKSHFSGLMEDAIGKDAESLGPGILNSPLSKMVTLTEESSSILKNCGEVEVTKEPSRDDIAGHSVKQADVYQLTKNVEEEVTDSNRTNAKIYTSNIPCKTRQSSRLQDADVCMQGKAIARKAFTKGALWSIWKSRNDVVFNKKIVTSPVALIYKTLMLSKTWRPLLKQKRKPMADKINRISANAVSVM
ncbi:uncharacterized protein [Miscanthus floridulus]|uniref:uncharacterized protein n=1 Tax=Miscanthus floridulus TaxID=154761 RepID=UPI00345B2B89